jgi:hypothetical protein
VHSLHWAGLLKFVPFLPSLGIILFGPSRLCLGPLQASSPWRGSRRARARELALGILDRFGQTLTPGASAARAWRRRSHLQAKSFIFPVKEGKNSSRKVICQINASCA